jgi:hypothetical protein
MHRVLRLGWILSVAAWVSACSDSDSDSARGRAGASCYPNGTCNDGLICESGVCEGEAPPGGCTPGESITCACPDGTVATQVCTDGRSLTRCGCGGGGSGGVGGAGTSGGAPGSGNQGGTPPGGGTSTPGEAGGTGGGVVGGVGGQMSGLGPIFLSLAANTMLLKPKDSLVITAVLTDPDGIDDLIGGSITDPDTGGSYGAFATAAAEGSYSISLGWDAINAVRPIDAMPGGSPRVFRSEFFDVAGNKATRDISITFACDAGDVSPAFFCQTFLGEPCTPTLCGGVCTEVRLDPNNCGTCRNVCQGSCNNGQCQ